MSSDFGGSFSILISFTSVGAWVGATRPRRKGRGEIKRGRRTVLPPRYLLLCFDSRFMTVHFLGFDVSSYFQFNQFSTRTFAFGNRTLLQASVMRKPPRLRVCQ